MIQVYIDESAGFERNALYFHVFDRRSPDIVIYHGDGTSSLHPQAEGAVTPRYPIILPRDAAYPLLGALSRHLGAVEHPQQLRADHDHLRRRHDLLVDHLLTQVASVPAAIELATRVAKFR